MNKDQEKKRNRELVSKINTISQQLVGVRPTANYVISDSIRDIVTFDITRKPYRVLKIKEWLEEEKWRKLKSAPQPVMAGKTLAYSVSLDGAYHSIDAEEELTKMLSEEISRAIQKEESSNMFIGEHGPEYDKIRIKLHNEELEIKENGDTFKSTPNKR